MPTATSDNTPAMIVSAGQTNSDDSLSQDRRSLTKMGLSKKSITRLLAGTDSMEYLGTRVTAGANLVFIANSMEEIQRAQRRAYKLTLGGKIKDERARIACLVAVAQLGVAIVRSAEESLSQAEKLDSPEPPPAPAAPPELHQHHHYEYPPVAKARQIPRPPSARNGDEGPLENGTLVKPSA